MVWHSYMLNPRCYNEDALHFGLRRILRSAFPWASIVRFPPASPPASLTTNSLQHAAIDNDTFKYTLPSPAAQFFQTLSAQSPSLIEELLWKDVAPRKRLRCYHCGKDDVDVRVCDSEKHGRGWMDPAFAVECAGCGGTIDKSGLCAAKFSSDMDAFLKAGDQGRMRFVPRSTLTRWEYSRLTDRQRAG